MEETIANTEYKIVPKSKNLKGIAWESSSPTCTSIFFLSPPISSKGDALRDAIEKWQNNDKIDGDDKASKSRKVMIEGIVESAKLQYFVEKRENSGTWTKCDNESSWVEALGDHITDVQLPYILSSIAIGEKQSLKDLIRNTSTIEDVEKKEN